MKFNERVALPGSERQPAPFARLTGTVAPGEQISVSVILRRRSAGHPSIGEVLSHDDLMRKYGAHQDDITAVEEFAREYGLTVASSNAAMRRVVLQGTAEQFERAFNAALHCYQVDHTGPHFRGRTGSLHVPRELTDAIVAILGLDNRPAAKPHFRIKPHVMPTGSFSPTQIAELYNFPANVDGSGQTIAIIELGGGYKDADLRKYFASQNVKAPTVVAVGVDGASNQPGDAADGEVLLDIEVAGAIAPGARIAVYFAPNTDQGFVDAILDAAHDKTNKPSVISISWGSAEDQWTDQARNAVNQALQDCAALGITVTVAAGDNGSTDGMQDGKLHVDFPASSPFALACGGTTLRASGSQVTSESVWNEIAISEGATGGGISNLFPLPPYQASAGVPANPQTNFAGRGVPDIAGDADPSTGYQVLVDGQATVVGGTSAVAPLWAALVALLNQSLGRPVGFLNPVLYQLGGNVTNDITEGNNDDSGLGSYSAAPGWDPCTGLGSPNGAALLSALQAQLTGSSGNGGTSAGAGNGNASGVAAGNN